MRFFNWLPFRRRHGRVIVHNIPAGLEFLGSVASTHTAPMEMGHSNNGWNRRVIFVACLLIVGGNIAVYALNGQSGEAAAANSGFQIAVLLISLRFYSVIVRF